MTVCKVVIHYGPADASTYLGQSVVGAGFRGTALMGLVLSCPTQIDPATYTCASEHIRF